LWRETERHPPRLSFIFIVTYAAVSFDGAPRGVKIRHNTNFLKADPAYGKGVADALCIPLSEVPK
jgi:catalase